VNQRRDSSPGYEIIRVKRHPAGVWGTVKGLIVTMVNMLKSMFMHDNPTIEYPETRRQYSERFRGYHVLKRRGDGSLRCVACFMCATVCPAQCIHIEAGEHPDKRIEKYPVVFEIDMLRCVYCGFCVDACPEEAIVMSQDFDVVMRSRDEWVWGIDELAEPKSELHRKKGFSPEYDEAKVARYKNLLRSRQVELTPVGRPESTTGR